MTTQEADGRLPSSVAMLRRTAVAIAALVSLAGCGELRREFLPRTHTTSTSPDGRWSAWVRQGFNIDPPDDHLFIKGPDGQAFKLADLAPDADWCRTIIWTQDSTKAGFLITDNRLSVFDLRSREHVAEIVLVKIDGYPGSEAARNIAFTDAGRTVTFERTDRRSQRLLARETLTLPTARLRVQPVWSDTGESAGRTWAKLVAQDGQEVRVSVNPGPDGVATLPAFRDGRLRIVELWAYRPGRTVILRDQDVSAPPVTVRFERPGR
jgi:hypothetical protein